METYIKDQYLKVVLEMQKLHLFNGLTVQYDSKCHTCI